MEGGGKVDRCALNDRWMLKTEKKGNFIKFWLQPILTQREFFQLGPLEFRSLRRYRFEISTDVILLERINSFYVCPFASR